MTLLNPDFGKVIYIRYVMTHAEYDKGGYEDDCTS